MLIEIKDLEIHPVDFREEFSPGVIDLARTMLGSGRRCAAKVEQIWSKSITVSTRWCRTFG
jgi:hypothetical protein